MSAGPNSAIVGVRGKSVVVVKPPREMTREEAKWFAAWIVTMASAANPDEPITPEEFLAACGACEDA